MVWRDHQKQEGNRHMTQKIRKFSSLTLRDGISFVEHLELNQMASPCGPIDSKADAAAYSNNSKDPTKKAWQSSLWDTEM